MIGLGGLMILLVGVVLGVVWMLGLLPWGRDVDAEAPIEVEEVLIDEVTPGASDSQITFGQSAALSGSASGLGVNMRRGIEAAFNEVNLNGGVHGRQLTLVSLDDVYEPSRAISNTIALIEETQVFALIGAVGTPTSRSAAPVAAEAGVPYIAPFTGADLLRDTSKLSTVITCEQATIKRPKRWLSVSQKTSVSAVSLSCTRTTRSEGPACGG